MEESTTDAAVQDVQAQDAQPVIEQQAEAETSASEPIQTQEAQDEPVDTDNSAADESKTVTPEWLQSKGLDTSVLEDPEKLKLANMAFNQEKLMSKTRQQATQLEKQMQSLPETQYSEDPMVQEALSVARRAETTLAVSQWKQEKGITPAEDQALGEYVSSNPNLGQLYKQGALTLDNLYAMYKADTTDTAAIKKEGAKEALEGLANKQRTAAPTGNAVSSAPAPGVTKDNVEQWWEGLGREGRNDPANRAKLDAILAS